MQERYANLYEHAGGTMLPRLKKFFYNAETFHLRELAGLTMNWPGLEETLFTSFSVKPASVQPVFTIVNGFGGTLRRMSLILHREEMSIGKLGANELKRLSLDLPHVEDFTLSVYRLNLNTVDFILPMASLRKLRVIYVKKVSSFGKKTEKQKAKPGPASAPCSEGDENMKEIIQFSNYISRLYDSNIWSLFPDLREVEISVISVLKRRLEDGEAGMQTKEKIYTREGYKQHLADGSGANGVGDIVSK